MRLNKRQLKRIIREEKRKLLNESREECLQALKDWSGDWEYSDQECLDWWMSEGDHLVDYLTDIDASELSSSGAALLDMLKSEFGFGGGDDYGYGY